MEGSVTRQEYALEEAPQLAFEAKVKCLTVMVFEHSGKTVIQPVVTKEEAIIVRDLFQNSTLEVWMPNGKADRSQFDINILKYKQLLQPSKMCSRIRNHVCLKNAFETIVGCEQCPLYNGAEE
jgi:hypothetical protein